MFLQCGEQMDTHSWSFLNATKTERSQQRKHT